MCERRTLGHTFISHLSWTLNDCQRILARLAIQDGTLKIALITAYLTLLAFQKVLIRHTLMAAGHQHLEDCGFFEQWESPSISYHDELLRLHGLVREGAAAKSKL